MLVDHAQYKQNPLSIRVAARTPTRGKEYPGKKIEIAFCYSTVGCIYHGLAGDKAAGLVAGGDYKASGLEPPGNSRAGEAAPVAFRCRSSDCGVFPFLKEALRAGAAGFSIFGSHSISRVILPSWAPAELPTAAAAGFLTGDDLPDALPVGGWHTCREEGESKAGGVCVASVDDLTATAGIDHFGVQ